MPAGGGEPGAGQRRGARRGADRHPPTSTSSRSPADWPPARPSPRSAAEHVTKVAVELGGKNPHIVFADRRLGQRRRPGAHRGVPALRPGVLGGHPADRRGVHRRRLRRRRWSARAEKIRMGDGMDPASETGPLVSEQHRAKVEAYVAAGISEGAKLVTGGARPTRPGARQGQFLPAHDLRPVRPVDANRRRRRPSGRS